MAKIETNKFTTVIFESEEERRLASTFSTPNMMYLASLRSQAALTRLSLRYNPEHPLLFLQDEAYLKAKIELLDELMGEKESTVDN